MFRGLLKSGRRAALATALALCMGGAAQADVIYSNTVGGDAFNVNLGGGGANRRGEAVGATNWYYNNVGGNATIGINGSPAWAQRSGNGSVVLQGVDGNSKADIEFLPNATHTPPDGVFSPGGALGQLKDLTAFSYDWYRDGSSTNPAVQAPALRLMLFDAASGNNGYLVFESTYNLPPPYNVTTNAWVTENVLANNSIMWTTGSLPNSFTFSTHLNTWMSTDPTQSTSLGNYYVVGVSAGMGSGWNGQFLGAVDNISFGFSGQNKTYNFEVNAVPEPASIVSVLTACGLGLAASAYRRRRAR